MKHAKIQLFISLCIVVLFFLSNPIAGQIQQENKEAPSSPSSKYADCLQCHDYTKNHHPVFFEPIRKFPFPLFGGKVTCQTCHFGDHETGGRYFLRGGPYLQQRDICFQCHNQKNYAGLNPHKMLNKDGSIRRIVGGKTVCIVCHETRPDPEVDRTEDVQFRADVGFLCWRCHPPMANALFQHEHLLVEPSLEMLQGLKKNEKEMNVVLPLVPRDRVTCSTCHNPHQSGVIRKEAAARGADAPNRLRIPSPRLCFFCHPF